MSRSLRSTVLTVLAAAAGLQCGGGGGHNAPTLTITASPNPVYIISTMGMTNSFTTVTITGTDQGAPLTDGTTGFTITTNYGSLGTPSTGPGTDTQSDASESVNGTSITVQLYADTAPPPNGGSAIVKVSYTDAYSLTATAQTSVMFKPGNDRPACTPMNMQQGCAALVERLSFSCDSYNLGVFEDTDTSEEEPCNSTATDSLDNPVDGTQINYLAEAGTMQYDMTAGNLAYFPNDPNALHTMPIDTIRTQLDNYMGGSGTSAEAACCTWTDSSGATHNPRDGLVTIIAWVYADPAAVMDAPIMMYEGEPFVDANDNQQYDMGEDFVDLNNNGTWDAQQDTGAQMALWRQIKILWTGSEVTNTDPIPAPLVSPNTATIAYGATQAFNFVVVDSNSNVLADNDPTNDGITSWNLSPSGDLSLGIHQSMTTLFRDSSDPRHLGMLIDPNFNFTDPFLAKNWMVGGYVTLTVANTYMCNSTNMPENFSVFGQISHNLYLDSSGSPTDQSSEESTVPVGGTLINIPASTCL